MWGQKAREIKRQKARGDRLVAHLEEARDALQTERNAKRIIARNYHEADCAVGREGAKTKGLQVRHDRALRIIAKLRGERDAQDRRIAALQQRLDDALGLNSDAVAMGSSWQDRRADKRATYRRIDEVIPSAGATAAEAEQGEVAAT